jgi:hypothetical protein
MAYTKGMIGQLYIQFGAKPFTYKEAGIHFATLNAAANRGWLIKNGSQYQVTQRGMIFTRIEQLASGSEFISLKKNNDTIGMLCSIRGMDLLDAWDKPYDVSGVVEYRLHSIEWNKIFPNK